MGNGTYHSCQDAGDVYCPCDLGLAGMCLSCPAMNDDDDCSRCAWSGACILLQKEHHLDTTPHERSEVIVEVIGQRPIGARAFLLTVRAPRYLLDGVRPPGSFLLMRPRRLPPRYNVPLTVAAIDGQKSCLSFYVQDVGVKSRTLTRPTTEIVARGPYRNGLIGIARLWQHPGVRVLIVAKGIGQGVAMRLTECLTERGYKVDVALGPGEINVILGKERLRSLSAQIIDMPKTPDRNRQQLKEQLERHPYGALISAGSDQQHRSLASLARTCLASGPFVFTNNAVMSCAEGVCGSCQTQTGQGSTRACKASDWPWPDEEDEQ